jgi:hypothetical protein
VVGVSLRRHHRVLVLGFAVLAALAIVLNGSRTSSATFSTVSQTSVYGRADLTSDWLDLLSDESDPGRGGYAPRRHVPPWNPPVYAAEGRGEGLTVDLGDYPDYKADFALPRVFTLVTPPEFPGSGIGQITVTATLFPDASGIQPLRRVTITPLSGTGNQANATMIPGQRYQLNAFIRSKRNFQVGTTYYPRVRITVTFTGSPANYYYYDIPMAFTDAGA